MNIDVYLRSLEFYVFEDGYWLVEPIHFADSYESGRFELKTRFDICCRKIIKPLKEVFNFRDLEYGKKKRKHY